MEPRLFNLDPQLLHDAVLLAIAVFVMFLFLSYMLFNPAREMLKKRQDKVKNDIDSAEKSREDAAKLKEEYENRLREIHKEEDAILSAARQKALENETKIIDQAKAEAANIIERANHQAELEMKKAQDEIKKENMKGGLDVITGKALLPSIEGIWDNYRVKRQFSQLSTVIASQLLLVDEVMSAGKNMGSQSSNAPEEDM